MPTVGIRDIEIQARENDLVLASFGRGFYILDDYSPLRHISDETKKENRIYPIKKGLMYQQSAPMAGGARAFQGANFYTAPNPAFGVAFTYHLKDSLKTKQSERKEKDSKDKKAGKDVHYPSWDELKAEDREIGPKVWLTIRDSEGNVVRRLSGSTSKGMKRTHWDFRHGGSRGGRRGGGGGSLAAPGTYTVDISQMVDGEITELVAATEFEIEPLGFDGFDEPDRLEIIEFTKQANKLAQAVNAASSLASDAQEQLDAMENTISSTPALQLTMLNDVRAIKTKLIDVLEKFNGDPTRSRRSESAYPGFTRRIRTMMFGAMGSYEGPTGTHRSQYDIVDQEFSEALDQLKEILESDVPALHDKMDEAGAPWTPGRKIPDWK